MRRSVVGAPEGATEGWGAVTRGTWLCSPQGAIPIMLILPRNPSIRLWLHLPFQRSWCVKKLVAFIPGGWGKQILVAGRGFPRHPPIPLPPPPPSSFTPAPPGLCPHRHRPYFMTTSQYTQLLFKVLIWEAYGDGCSLPWSVPFLTNGFSSPYI